VTCLRATPAYSTVWPDDSPFLHCAYGALPCSSSVIPLFPARKTVLYCHQTSVFSKYPYSRMWPDDSSFLVCKCGVLLCSSNVNTSVPCTQNCAIQLSKVRIFEIYHAKILRKFKKFSLNAQSLRLWKSSFTQNWIHSTIFEKLIISFWKCTYATSCSYILCHRSGIRTVSIPVTKYDIICAQEQLDCTWLFPIVGFPYSAIVHVKAAIVMLLSGDTCRGCPTGRPQTSSV